METIGIGQSLVITVFSMIVVFIVLLGISFLIDLLRIVVERGNSKKTDTVKETKVAEKKVVKDEVVEEAINDEELVAVISAAVAASMGVSIPEINIKSIKRVENTWKNVARNEQVLKNI